MTSRCRKCHDYRTSGSPSGPKTGRTPIRSPSVRSSGPHGPEQVELSRFGSSATRSVGPPPRPASPARSRSPGTKVRALPSDGSRSTTRCVRTRRSRCPRVKEAPATGRDTPRSRQHSRGAPQTGSPVSACWCGNCATPAAWAAAGVVVALVNDQPPKSARFLVRLSRRLQQPRREIGAKCPRARTPSDKPGPANSAA